MVPPTLVGRLGSLPRLPRPSRNAEAKRRRAPPPRTQRARIRAYPALTVRRTGQKKHPSPESYYAWASSLLGKKIQPELAALLRNPKNAPNALFGFVRNIDPQLCEFAREKKLRVITDQMIAPMAEEERQAALQQQRWPGWQTETPSAGAALVRQVEERTWKTSDHITCASDYVREGLLAQKIPAGRISVLPYPLDATHFPFVNRAGRRGAVTVGFVGAVGLRKGAPYFFEVARRLASPALRFVMVGPVQLDAKIAAEKKGPVELVGVVPRLRSPQLPRHVRPPALSLHLRRLPAAPSWKPWPPAFL